MRLAFISPVWPWRGGIAQFTAVLAKRLQEAGHQVHIFNLIEQYPDFLFPGKNQLDESPIHIKVPMSRCLIPWDPVTWADTVRRIRNWRPDLLTIVYWLPFFAPAYGTIIRALGIRPTFPVGYLLHNVIPHEAWPLTRTLTRFALRTADFHVTLSRQTSTELVELLGQQCAKKINQQFHPVYHYYAGLRDPRPIPEAQGHPTLMFFGFIKPYKGLSTLLEAMPLVRNAIPDIRLLVAGEIYGDRTPYVNLIKRLGLTDSVILHDRYIPSEEVGDWFASCDAVVLPYRCASQSGIASLAYAFEKPVLASSVGSLPDMIDHGVNGLLFPPDDPEALAKTVVEFYRKPDILAEGARQYRKRHDWQPLVETMESLCRKPVR